MEGKKLNRYFRIYLLRLKLSFKILVNSFTNFIIGILGFLIIQVTGIVFLNITFSNIPSIEGISKYSILALYGFSQISRGLDHFYSDYLWHLSISVIIKGEYDKFLLRPLNTFFQVLIEKTQFDALGEILIGLLIYLYGLKGLGIGFSFKIFFLSVLLSVVGSIIYTCFKSIAASFAFVYKDTYFLLKAIYSMSDFTRFPINIYPRFLQIFLTYIVSFAITSYYPMDVIINMNMGSILKIIFVSIGLIILTAYIWRRNEVRYESSGA